jgi:hypothetical protein
MWIALLFAAVAALVPATAFESVNVTGFTLHQPDPDSVQLNLAIRASISPHRIQVIRHDAPNTVMATMEFTTEGPSGKMADYSFMLQWHDPALQVRNSNLNYTVRTTLFNGEIKDIPWSIPR